MTVIATPAERVRQLVGGCVMGLVQGLEPDELAGLLEQTVMHAMHEAWDDMSASDIVQDLINCLLEAVVIGASFAVAAAIAADEPPEDVWAGYALGRARLDDGLGLDIDGRAGEEGKAAP